MTTDPRSISSVGKVLVYGGNGVQGRAIAQELHDEGFEVVASIRDQEKASALTTGNIPIICADLSRPETLLSASRGADAVVLTVPLQSSRELKTRSACPTRLLTQAGRTAPSFDDDAEANASLCARQSTVREGGVSSNHDAPTPRPSQYFLRHVACARAVCADSMRLELGRGARRGNTCRRRRTRTSVVRRGHDIEAATGECGVRDPGRAALVE